MNKALFRRYFKDLHDLPKVMGNRNERTVQRPFINLVDEYARSYKLTLATEQDVRPVLGSGKARRTRSNRVDAVVKTEFRLSVGYIESKDTNDDLDEEIQKKFRQGYPQNNIIFEDTRQVVLIQDGDEVSRCKIDPDNLTGLDQLIRRFLTYEYEELREFRRAGEQYGKDLPEIIKIFREAIDEALQDENSGPFQMAALAFIAEAKVVIRQDFNFEHLREMLIQQIVTEDLFVKIFDNRDFLSHNSIAKRIKRLEVEFFKGTLKRQTLKNLRGYYASLCACAAHIHDRSEKRRFVQSFYERFSHLYNPKDARRFGVFYTPDEIVQFILQGAESLCQTHFGKSLLDKGVSILDPATGTGTFLCEFVELFHDRPRELRYKFENEIFANEISLLAYHVAKLLIENTLFDECGEWLPFKGLCFWDTLAPFDPKAQKTYFTPENTEHIQRQKACSIHVRLGNPPYRAHQTREDDDNKNEPHPGVSARIRETYAAKSKARNKQILSDPFVGFIRQSTDELPARGGIIGYVVNRSFLTALAFDGFRKTLVEEFNVIYVLDLGGDVRADPKLSGIKNNVFGIQTGVTILFLVRRKGLDSHRVLYKKVPEKLATGKLTYLRSNTLESIAWTELQPDADGNWLRKPQTHKGSTLPLVLKTEGDAIFSEYSIGISTNRDQWVYDSQPDRLETKMRAFIERFEAQKNGASVAATKWRKDIKWSDSLKTRFHRGQREPFDEQRITEVTYRPFVTRWLYNSPLYLERGSTRSRFFPPGEQNLAICFSNPGSRSSFCALATAQITDMSLLPSSTISQVPLARFEAGPDGQKRRVSNVTDWALEQFRSHYQSETPQNITKEAIFCYVYAVLHDPAYREVYKENLRLTFPQIPLYPSFFMWAGWGKELLLAHTKHQSKNKRGSPSFKFEREDRDEDDDDDTDLILNATPNKGRVLIDSCTTLTGIPPEAWEYRIADRSAIDWVLKWNKPKKVSDPSIRRLVGNYPALRQKEEIIRHLGHVVAASIETVRIIKAMRIAPH